MRSNHFHQCNEYADADGGGRDRPFRERGRARRHEVRGPGDAFPGRPGHPGHPYDGDALFEPTVQGERPFPPFGRGGGFPPFGREGAFPPFGREVRVRRGGPGRGRKGDVRAAILALLAESDRPMNGYQLIGAIAEKSDGLWSPGAGSIYPALGLLEDEGLVVPVEEEGKKRFALTDDGREHLEQHPEARAPWDRVAEPHRALLDVRPDLEQLGMAVQQVVVTGDEAQVEAARAILERARKEVYRLLAGDTRPTRDARGTRDAEAYGSDGS